MFALRFSAEAIPHWAAQYQYPGETEIEYEVAPRIRERGFITHAELVTLCHWKSPRIRTRCGGNSAEFVEAVTQTALTTPNERLRIEVLLLLQGVGWPMASVILHWCHPDPYPILDFRALWSLGIDQPPHYAFGFWEAYTSHCRQLAARAGVSMRLLDRALWSYSKFNQS